MTSISNSIDRLYNGLALIEINSQLANVIEWPFNPHDVTFPIIAVENINFDGPIKYTDNQSDFTKITFGIFVFVKTERDNSNVQKEDKQEMLNIINDIQSKTYCKYTDIPRMFATVIDSENVYAAYLKGEL